MDFYFRLYNKSHIGEIYKTSLFVFSFSVSSAPKQQIGSYFDKKIFKNVNDGEEEKEDISAGQWTSAHLWNTTSVNLTLCDRTHRKEKQEVSLCSCTKVHWTNWKQAGHLTCNISRVPETTILLNPPIKSDFFWTWGGSSWLVPQVCGDVGLRTDRTGHLCVGGRGGGCSQASGISESDQACEASLSMILL